MPTVSIERARLEAGIGVLDLFFEAGLAATKSEARRLVEQGGAAIGDRQVGDVKAVVGVADLDASGEIVLRAGKKKFVRVVAG
jgi:tyrosyl-tRNA synthetase